MNQITTHKRKPRLEQRSHRIDPDVAELWDIYAVSRYFGGTKSLNYATVYRMVSRNVIPRPIKIGPLARWIPAECRAAREALIAARDAA